MPPWTKRLCPLLCSTDKPSFTTGNVLCTRHWLKMRWTDTSPGTAEVVKAKACWNGAYKKFIGKAMGTNQLVFYPKIAISVHCGSLPYPASIRLFHLRPEATLPSCLIPVQV